MTELSTIQKLRLRIFGHVPVGTRRKEGWSAAIMHYAFKCPIHGIQVDYPHGFREELRCPKCLEKWLARRQGTAKK